MFWLLSAVGIVVLFSVLIVCILIGEPIQVPIVLAATLIVLLAARYYSVRTEKVGIPVLVTGAMLILFVMPIGFFYGGGLNGGSPVWFVFCFVYIYPLMNNITGRIYAALTLVVTASCYYIAYRHPEYVSGHPGEAAYLDSFFSVVMLSILICVMIIFQRIAFERENALVNQQKQEIMDLNESQNHFFSSMSHEIRTPINTIIGLNEMILREDISEEVAENAQNIQSASRILLSLINDILDMSRIESGQMAIVKYPYDVGEMLSELVNMIWGRARDKGLAFHMDVAESLPSRLVGDEVRIKQVLINILNNAVKYTNEGSVTFSITCKRTSGNRVEVSYAVRDTGIGISSESLPHLFNAFKRVDEEKNRYIEGTGLGLSIVKQLSDLMGGRLTVDSIYTRGSTFVFTLEQDIDDETEIGEFNINSRRIGGKTYSYNSSFEAPNAKILIVDDNEVNLLVAGKLLRDTKVRIDMATNGADALKDTMRLHYDLIFMDHMMPEMDGIECLHSIRSQNGGLNKETPVVALTANAGSDAVAKYEREGFDDCLLKPISSEKLEKTVIKYLPPSLVIMSEGDAVYDEEEKLVSRRSNRIPVIISTESVCDLPAKYLAKQNVRVLPFSIRTEGGDFQDGLEIDSNATLLYIEQQGKDARTLEAEVPEYIRFFAGLLEQAQQVIHIAIGKGTNGAFPKASVASQTFDNVTVINSEQISCGLGLLVYRASQMAEQGMAAREIIENVELLKRRIDTSFILESTKFLKRNGRIPARANVMCEAFMLHPCVVMTSVGMRMKKLYSGKRDFVWKRYIAITFKDSSDIDTSLLFIAYSGLSSKDLRAIEEQVNDRIKFDKVIRQKVSSSSSTMFGPGTFGLIFARR